MENKLDTEYFVTHKDVRETVVLIHGWKSNPETVMHLARAMHERLGVNVFVPVIPGHGKCAPNEFIKSTDADWIFHIESGIRNLEDEGYNIEMIGGLSMGACIAAIVADNLSIENLLLISPAFKNKNRWIVATRFLRHFVSHIKKCGHVAPPLGTFSQAYLENQDKVYNRYHWITPAYHLNNIQKLAISALDTLPEVVNDIKVIISRDDETIGMNNAKLFIRKFDKVTKLVNFDMTTLRSGYHNILNDERCYEDLESVNDHVVRLACDWYTKRVK